MEEADNNSDPPVLNAASNVDSSPKNRAKPRGKKRKRKESESASESDDGLPENAIEVEKNVIASAVKNNLDDVSVKKILKKVVTNDHVLAFVKLREEEESNTEESKLIPKLTRSKVKELTKVSPKSAQWDFQNLELTPIKHIPVKTRPEVKALIAQELPEDEDDEEYEPAHDEVPSDDDQGLESCSDLDSQPRTPATPRGQQKISPKVVNDGPFKVPQDVSTPVRRKLELEEEATIALRTRSKLCLSETPIEHIESSFVPPDELPVPVDDHLWNDFLTECLNPAEVSKHEDDDETDPEYSVAADPDAHDDDEEALERSIIKISKKELNDLVTELFNIMPEESVDNELANISNAVLASETNNQTPPRWEGKQEPQEPVEEETSTKMVDRMVDRIVFERRCSISVGKMEPQDQYDDRDQEREASESEYEPEPQVRKRRKKLNKPPAKVVDICVEETPVQAYVRPAPAAAPPPPLRHMHTRPSTTRLQLRLHQESVILPEQIQILQQQLRQHIQLTTSNFLQVFVHPIHWALGPTYKEYLQSLVKIADSNPKSVVNVCNLKPAMELCETWAKTVSEDTPENKEMVEFIQSESERCQRRIIQNNLYSGDFHETFKRTVANSPVFLYPFLLPPMPYRPESASRRFNYTPSEDALMAIGLQQFWEYVDSNPQMYKKPARPNPRHRWGLAYTLDLMVKHMFPWLSPSALMHHVAHHRRARNKDNPIHIFFEHNRVDGVKHRLIPYNPALTLYEQPAHEMPRVWARYLAKTSKRFKMYIHRRRSRLKEFTGSAPEGVPVDVGLQAPPPKNPLPIDFTKEIRANRIHCKPIIDKPKQKDKFDLEIEKPQTQPNFYKLVETSTGVNLVPLTLEFGPVGQNVSETNTVTCNVAPISSIAAVDNSSTIKVDLNHKDGPRNSTGEHMNVLVIPKSDPDHCKCCVMLRTLCKRQKMITDYFKSNRERSEVCKCRRRRNLKVSNKLRLLADAYKRRSECYYRDLKKKLKCDKKGNENNTNIDNEIDCNRNDELDQRIVTTYQIKITARASGAKNLYTKRTICRLFEKFDPDFDDALVLSKNLEQAFKEEMLDMHVEFIGFLTAEQADKIGRFRDYFVVNCVEGLVAKVEELVKDPNHRESILHQLSACFGARWSACGLCAALLARMQGYPRLAAYTFHLFPHWWRKPNPEKTNEETDTAAPKESETHKDQQPGAMEEEDPADDAVTDGEGIFNPSHYEADHSSSGDDDSDAESVQTALSQAVEAEAVQIKKELATENYVDTQPMLCKTEPTEDSSDMSMMIMSEDETIIKTEQPEWKREEDKLILEVLKANLTPEERKDKTILEILDEKQVVEVLSESLPNKSRDIVQERVAYLLNVLLLGEP